MLEAEHKPTWDGGVKSQTQPHKDKNTNTQRRTNTQRYRGTNTSANRLGHQRDAGGKTMFAFELKTNQGCFSKQSVE